MVRIIFVIITTRKRKYITILGFKTLTSIKFKFNIKVCNLSLVKKFFVSGIFLLALNYSNKYNFYISITLYSTNTFLLRHQKRKKAQRHRRRLPSPRRHRRPPQPPRPQRLSRPRRPQRPHRPPLQRRPPPGSSPPRDLPPPLSRPLPRPLPQPHRPLLRPPRLRSPLRLLPLSGKLRPLTPEGLLSTRYCSIHILLRFSLASPVCLFVCNRRIWT